MGTPKDYKLEDKDESNRQQDINFHSELTEEFGFILYGFYHLASIIILLNMLIASMTQSYEKILVNLLFDSQKFYLLKMICLIYRKNQI